MNHETPSLFGQQHEPLAHRLRPGDLSEFVGQKHLLGEGKPITLWLKARKFPSMILWGPPGVGKTTLALLMARSLHAHVEALSAVQSGAKDIREVCEGAIVRATRMGASTVLFLDEIHRLNRGQQDVLLPYVERGAVTLIGATTENPSFELNSALLSRCRVLRLEQLSPEDIQEVLRRAPHSITDGMRLKLSDRAYQMIAERSHGDLRRALTLLESVAMAEQATPLDDAGLDALLTSLLSSQAIPYDASGEDHYNTISAFIKSMRASDADAAVYYLARMLEGGEDPLFVARRMVVFAAEDIGNADPRALIQAMACQQAVDFVGMPESRIVLSETVIYLARAKKNREAYEAIEKALSEVRESGALPVPMHLRNATYPKAVPDAEGNLPLGLKSKQFTARKS